MQAADNGSAHRLLGAKPSHINTLLQLLKRYSPDAEVWAYGSRVNGDGHECSDLDLVLRNANDLKKPIEGFFDLKEAIEASNIPFFVEIHDWAYLPTSFHEQITRNYVTLIS